MTNTDQKTVVIGVSGCIAAYKSCEILRGLQKAGIRVKVVMTEHATHFVDPLTFRALTNEPVAIGLFDNPQDPIHHISLAQEADILLLAPCTANVLAKAAHGIADDLLSTTILATTAPVMVAPAMNVHMYENAATQENISTLKRRGFTFIDADEGYLACGDVGRGRLADPAVIVDAVLNKLEQMTNPAENGLTTVVTDTPTQRIPTLSQSLAQDNATHTTHASNHEPHISVATPYTSNLSGQTSAMPAVSDSTESTSTALDSDKTTVFHALDLAGKHVMITAGPTVEPIDPVRYLTNRSSGKFGYAIAQAAIQRGAKVTLISGPVALPAPEGAEMIYIETAQDLLEASEKVFPSADIALFAAAVADVRPANPAEQKLKKGVNDKELSSIALTENPDILATLGCKKENRIVVGFAAETNDVVEYAKKKLTKKNADMIVANEVGANKTFGEDHDEIWLVTEDDAEHIDRATKAELAQVILSKALKLK